jgi:hypothetical protein
LSNEQNLRELALITARAKLIELIAARAPERLDRYADLRSQARTRAAWDLISQVYWGIAEHEQTSGRRVLRRRARTGAKLDDAIQRFVGDLLRARTGTNATGRIYRPTGNSQFSDVPVTSDKPPRSVTSTMIINSSAESIRRAYIHRHLTHLSAAISIA